MCVCMCVLIVYFFSLLSKSYVLWFILKQVSVLWAWSSCEHDVIRVAYCTRGNNPGISPISV